MRTVFSVLGMVLGLNATSAVACGYCAEDRMASVYDHAVVTRALDRQHHIAFFAIAGTPAPGAGTQRAIERRVESAAGVDKGSAKASIESATLAVAFDPRRATIATLQQAVERQLVHLKLSLQPLRIIDQHGQVSAVENSR